MSQFISEPFCLQKAISRGFPRANHSDDRLRVKIRENTLIIQHKRRIVNIFQSVWVGCILKGQDPNALPVALLQDPPRRGKFLIRQRCARLRPQLLWIIAVCRAVDRFRAPKALQNCVKSADTDTLASSQPQPVFKHKNSSVFLGFFMISQRFICHRTIDAATAAFRDSHRGDMGMMIFPSAASNSS